MPKLELNRVWLKYNWDNVRDTTHAVLLRYSVRKDTRSPDPLFPKFFGLLTSRVYQSWSLGHYSWWRNWRSSFPLCSTPSLNVAVLFTCVLQNGAASLTISSTNGHVIKLLTVVSRQKFQGERIEGKDVRLVSNVQVLWFEQKEDLEENTHNKKSPSR